VKLIILQLIRSETLAPPSAKMDIFLVSRTSLLQRMRLAHFSRQIADSTSNWNTMTRPCGIRNVTIEDVEQINRLHDDVWFPTRSLNGWKWLLEDNPAQGDHAPGFVAVNQEDEVIGFIGNWVQEYWKTNQPITAHSGHSFIAHQNQAGAGIHLLKRILHERIGMCSFTLNGNALSEPIFRRFAGAKMFGENSRTRYYWVTNRRGYICAGMRRRCHSLMSYKYAQTGKERSTSYVPLERALFSLAQNCKLRRDYLSSPTDLAEFWERLQQTDSILASRSPEHLKWRLSNPDFTEAPIFITFDRGNGVEGWAIALPSKENEVAAPILTIVDLIALPQASDIAIPALTKSLLEIAQGMKLVKLSLPHANDETIKHLGPLLDQAKAIQSHTHAQYIVHSPHTVEELEKGWKQTPFDGDYSFCLRAFPKEMIKS
jgi:hypothetical protein